MILNNKFYFINYKYLFTFIVHNQRNSYHSLKTKPKKQQKFKKKRRKEANEKV